MTDTGLTDTGRIDAAQIATGRQPVVPVPTLAPAWPYEGHAVVIRPLQREDLPLVHDAAARLSGFSLYDPQQQRLCPTLADCEARFDWLQHFDPPLEHEAVVEDCAGRVIGTMRLSAIDQLNGKAEFSLFLLPGPPQRAWEAWHYGVAQAFHGLQLYKLLFLVSAHNARVLQLLQRLQVPHEGCLRSEILMADQQRGDLHRFALLQPEWASSRLAAFLAHRAPLRISGGNPSPQNPTAPGHDMLPLR